MSGISYATFEKDFRVEGRLGKGNYATVTRVLHLLDQRSYAHKCIELTTMEEYSQAFNEVETNRCIDDNRTVKICYYYNRENKKTGKFELGIIMELCSSNLGDLIKQRRRKAEHFSASELRDFLATMVPFFARMQRKGYLHRDIKPENILLVKNCFGKWEYKVGDFGFAIKMNAYSTQNIAGTMEYVSPKLLVKFKDNKLIVPGHTFKDDVYSFGKTLYEFMTLEMNAPIDPKKLNQCSARYGPEYYGLLAQMIKEAEIERPDFIYLESYAVKRELIGEEDSEVAKESFLSISTVNGAASKQRLGASMADRKSRSREKHIVADLAKTRKKDCELETMVSASRRFQTPKTNLKLLMVSEEVLRKKVINYNEDVHAMVSNDSCLFVGSEGRLGIMLLASEKIIKVKYGSPNQTLTCLRLDPLKRYLFFGTLDGRIYSIEISEIKKLLVGSNELFKKRNEVEIAISQVKHKLLQLEIPISALDCYYLDDGKEPSFVAGHHSGQITVISGESKTTQASFSLAPITHVAFHDGCVYSTNTEGLFKREQNLASNQPVMKEGAGKDWRFAVHEKNACYKYHSMFLCFQIIEDCKLNEGVKQDADKLLAILISYDGLAHVVNRSLKIRRIIPLSLNNLLAASFWPNPSAEMGVNGFAVDTEGQVYSEEGRLIESSQQRRAACIAGQPRQLYVGGFSKAIAVVSRREAVKIE